MFARLGPWCHDRRRLVLGLWIAVMFVAHGIAGGVGEDYRQNFNLPGAESSDGFDLLDERFGGRSSGLVGTVVFEAEQGVADTEVRDAMSAILADVAEQPGVTRVESPYDPSTFGRLVSDDGTVAYANVEMPEDVDFADATDVREMVLDRAPDIDGLDVELGGFLFAEFEEPTTELLGLGFAIVILIVAFGSVLAMGLPVGVALMGIGIGSAMVIIYSQLVTVPEFAPFLGLMIGLGVGIDYALLIVTRYREQLHAGHTVRESVQIAIDTAGRSVLFAGLTVVISLLGMILMGISFVTGLAISASTTVLLTVVASLTLLPALLGFAGDNVERTRWRGLVAAGVVAVAMAAAGLSGNPALVGVALPFVAVVIVASFFVPALKKEVTHRPPKPRRETVAYRWSRVIQRRPWTAALASGLALVILAVPVFGLRLAFSDESNFEDDTTTRQAYDLLVEGFGKGFNGPLFFVAEVPVNATATSLAAIGDAIQADPGIAPDSIFGPIFNDQAEPGSVRSAALWNAAPVNGPQDEATQQLVNRLRDDVIPGVEASTGTDISVTGIVAANVDSAQMMGERMPYFFLAVLILSFLLLMAVFRSLLVPLKAVVMNMLSIGAAYGVTVALFQWGWLSDLTDVSPGPIEPWAPMMLFAVVFGLSMDYEVFLLSRVREEWHRTGDSHTSVADGLAATAKVITAAAAIMVVVFGAFLLETDRTIKLMGTGLATAILLDATVVRMLLVPATMELLGDRNWWLPRWLDRILPNLDVEGHVEDAAPLDADEDREPALAD
jgi:putative drug exporter of the RND superfamily